MKRFLFPLLSLAAIASAACSALTSSEAAQCHSKDDCAKRGFSGWICSKEAVCVLPDPEGGSSGSGGNSSGGTDAKAGETSGGTPSMGGSAGGSDGGKAGQAAGGMGGMSLGGNGGVAGSAGSAGAGGQPNPFPCVASACTAAGGACKNDVCVIACTTADCAPQCPADMPCRVDCAANSCNGGLVDCGGASACQVTCGDSSCLKGVDCGGSSCTINCKGEKSCSNLPIDCHADACDIECPALQSCKELRCSGMPDTCNIACGGVQSCGTSFQDDAVTTTISCTAVDGCPLMKDRCCTGGAICTGAYKPTCP